MKVLVSLLRRSKFLFRYFLTATIFFNSVAQAQNFPVQTYYLPLPEEQMFDAILSVFDPATCPQNIGGFAPQEPTQTYVSVAVLDNGTVIYYDHWDCLLYTSPSPRDKRQSRMPSSA